MEGQQGPEPGGRAEHGDTAVGDRAGEEGGVVSLTPKQQRFVEEYLVDLNATQAAIRAGYSEKTAHSQGPRLLENVEISKAVAAAFASRSERVQVTQDWVISRLVDNVERAMTAEPVRDREGNETGVYVYNG